MNQGYPEYLPLRSACTCGCHQGELMHIAPCCRPDPAPAIEPECWAIRHAMGFFGDDSPLAIDMTSQLANLLAENARLRSELEAAKSYSDDLQHDLTETFKKMVFYRDAGNMPSSENARLRADAERMQRFVFDVGEHGWGRGRFAMWASRDVAKEARRIFEAIDAARKAGSDGK